MAFDKVGANPIDIYVGGRVKKRRKDLGLSQEDLARSINLTFQQVQKYERGSNRISVSKLFQIGQILRVRAEYFFYGYGEQQSIGEFTEFSSEKFINRFLMTKEGVELAETFPRISSVKVRRKILDLVKSLVDEA